MSSLNTAMLDLLDWPSTFIVPVIGRDEPGGLLDEWSDENKLECGRWASILVTGS